MASKMRKIDETQCPDYKSRKRAIESKEDHARLTGRDSAFRYWIDLKIQQYNVTCVLYMLEWWERLLFHVLTLSIFSGMVVVMFVYGQGYAFVSAWSVLVFGLGMLIVMLFPLHQF